ncbi:MAG: hypothetical protein LM593_03785 [Candidatus Verstraetearchaeota archaeon]|jgi:hypothetical protein|nr:hypothetical protein [Candidatus Verstraetearchaeota archaeon]
MSNELENKLKAFGIGRFQVMALLQAARYYKIHKDLEKAKSFGLNRAIFYAWAKHYGPRKSKIPNNILKELEEIKKLDEIKQSEKLKDYKEVLGEYVKISPSGLFIFGGIEQSPSDYDHQVTMKIDKLINAEKAWQVALNYISKFPEWILKDASKFYKYVYEPIRDIFFMELLNKGTVEPKKDIIERIKSLEIMLERAKKTQRTLMDFTQNK